MSVTGATSLISRSSRRRQGLGWAWPIAAAGLLAAAYGPLLATFFRQQWQKPHYQFFPFVIAAFGGLLYDRWRHGAPRVFSSRRDGWVDLGLLAFAALLLLAAIYPLNSPWGAAASLIVLAALGCRLLARRRAMRYVWGVWALLWLLLPLPFNLDQRLIVALQQLSSLISSYVLDLLGINHVMEGNTLWLPAKQLFVDEACSGIASILSVMACAVIYGVARNRAPLHLAALAAAGVGWAAIMNVVRISTIGFVLATSGVDWSAGTSHGALSLVLFLVALLTLLSTDQLLAVALAPIGPAWHELHSHDLTFGGRLAAAWDRVIAWGQPGSPPRLPAAPTPIDAGATRRAPSSLSALLVVAFVAPAAAQSGLSIYAARIAPENWDALPAAMAIDSPFLPGRLCGLEKTSFTLHERPRGHDFGRFSKTYVYGDPTGEAMYTVSLDFPFTNGWHELTTCYRANGWIPLERRLREPAERDGGGEWSFVEADFEKATGEHGAVFFAEFDQHGAPIRPQPGWTETGDTYLGVRNLYLRERHAFQVQVWITRAGVISSSDREKAVDLLLQVRRRFRASVADGGDRETASEGSYRDGPPPSRLKAR